MPIKTGHFSCLLQLLSIYLYYISTNIGTKQFKLIIMKLYFDEVLKRLTPLSREIIQTNNNEIFKTPTRLDENENPYWDIKLTINDVEFDPKILESLFTQTEEWIDFKAEEKVKDQLQSKLDDAEQKIRKLTNLLEKSLDNLKEEFDMDDY